jgi:Golgi nucleoside diphosphatase
MQYLQMRDLGTSDERSEIVKFSDLSLSLSTMQYLQMRDLGTSDERSEIVKFSDLSSEGTAL